MFGGRGGLAHKAPHPALRPAASTVFESSIAMVMGPSPPGTGVIQPARFAASSKPTSPTRLPASVRLMPTSNTAAPGLNPFAGNEARLADGGDYEIGALDFGTHILRTRVTHGRRGAREQQLQRHWPADDVRSTDDHGAQPAQRDPIFFREADHAQRRARPQAGPLLSEQSRIDRMKSIDILRRVD